MLTRWLLVVAMVVMLTPTVDAHTSTPVASPITGVGLYPDLQAIPPDDLYFSTEVLADGQQHELLRFTTAVANVGEGPLELRGDSHSDEQHVLQVIRDAPRDGNVVTEIPLGLDLIEHPEHHHIHLDQFAGYQLYRLEASGRVPVGIGGKQSSCLLDSRPLSEAHAGAGPVYRQCTEGNQGITPGWSDRYAASLPDQWVDLGPETLSDGEYVLSYTVDPLGQLAEDGRVGNNTAETGFTVTNGEILARPEPARCTIPGENHGAVGDKITLECSHFPPGVQTLIIPGEWDPWGPNSAPIATFLMDDDGAGSVTLAIPAPPSGSYVMLTVLTVDREGTVITTTVIVGVDEATPIPGG